MLKLLWSWIFLVIMVSLIMLYQPGLLSTHILLDYNGSQFDVQLWIVLFLIVLIVIMVLTASNFIFSWQRRILISKCKKLTKGIKTFEEIINLVKHEGNTKKLLNTIKSMPLSEQYRSIMLKSFFQEVDTELSLVSMWWHGHWQLLAERLLLSEAKSIWKMHFCCHLFLQGHVDNDLYKVFFSNWQNHKHDMQKLFPTVAYKVELDLLSRYSSKSDLTDAWDSLPKKYRKELDYILEYIMALSNLSEWQLIRDICVNVIPKQDSEQLLVWYARNMPVDYFEITTLQKWHKAKPNNKYILFALARSYANLSEWSTVQKLIQDIDDQELTYNLQLNLLVEQSDLTAIKQLVLRDSRS